MVWTSPTIVLALVLATLYAGLFHLLLGGGFRLLAVDWAASVVGMLAGQLAANLLAWEGPCIGELHVVASSVTAWIAMTLAHRLRM
jgi:hypothetical protein